MLFFYDDVRMELGKDIGDHSIMDFLHISGYENTIEPFEK